MTCPSKAEGHVQHVGAILGDVRHIADLDLRNEAGTALHRHVHALNPTSQVAGRDVGADGEVSVEIAVGVGQQSACSQR